MASTGQSFSGISPSGQTGSGARTVLVLDGDKVQFRALTAFAARGGWRAIQAQSLPLALAQLATHERMAIDAVVLDGASGDLALAIAELRTRRPALPILVLTGDGPSAIVMAALRAGANDFLYKPVTAERLLRALDRICWPRYGGEMRPLSEKLSADNIELTGSDPSFRSALARAREVAKQDAPVLIEGAPGVGKDSLAHAIHSAGTGGGGAPFVRVVCGAISPNLIESEIFGHERGAFPGAFAQRRGRLTEAAGGTLFLDQVDALSSEAQIRLVHYLECGQVTPLGGQPQPVTVRVVASANRPLADAVQAGHFREDLNQHLSATVLTLPSLRDRHEDIGPIAEALLRRLERDFELNSLLLADDAVQLFQRYDWPGNIRQLHDILFRAAARTPGPVLRLGDFPNLAAMVENPESAARAFSSLSQRPPVAVFDVDGHMRSLDAIEADVIRLAISHYRGRMTEVARRLGIGRSTLYRKLAELGISDAA